MPASDISDFSPVHSVNHDGHVCEEPRNMTNSPPADDSLQIRIDTFAETPLMHDGDRLAAAGFYYTGNGTIVKCFRCGRCIHSFTEDDNPCDARWHRPNCDLAGAGDAHPRNYSGEHSVHSHTELRERNRSIGAGDEFPYSANIPSTSTDRENEPAGAQAPVSSSDRDRKHQASGGAHALIPSSSGVGGHQASGGVHPGHGPIPSSSRGREHHVSGGVHPGHGPLPSSSRGREHHASGGVHPGHGPIPSSSRGREHHASGGVHPGHGLIPSSSRGREHHASGGVHPGHGPIPSSSRDREHEMEWSGAHPPILSSNRAREHQASGGAQGPIPMEGIAHAGGSSDIYEMFECLDPRHPNMADVIRRAQTFDSGWEARLQAIPEDLARAGFFYTGLGDRVRCWYCGELLENWHTEDDPWVEHAKWFPTCEHVLRHRGPDFVQGIVAQFPNLQRPVHRPAPVQPNPAAPAPPPPGNQQHAAPPPPPPVNQQNAGGAGGRGHRAGGVTISYPEGGGIVITTRSGKVIRTNRAPAGNIINIINTNRRQGRGNRLGRSNNNQPPQFVDPRQNIENYESLVQDTMTNSPMVQNLREMGYPDDAIKMVLLGKLQASGELYENIDEFVDALARYQEELDRIAPGSSSENQGQEASATASTSEGPSTSAGPSTSSGSSGEATNTPVEQLRRLEESRNCRICHRVRATVVLIPCGHVAICENCCTERNISVCPICKVMVTEKIRSFMA